MFSIASLLSFVDSGKRCLAVSYIRSSFLGNFYDPVTPIGLSHSIKHTAKYIKEGISVIQLDGAQSYIVMITVLIFQQKYVFC